MELLKSKYDAILQALPIDHERTLQAVQDHLTDDQICNVLGSSSSSSANEMILDCIAEKMKFNGDMLDVCDQLEKISSLSSDSSVLDSIIRELRKGTSVPVYCINHNLPIQLVKSRAYRHSPFFTCMIIFVLYSITSKFLLIFS